VALARIFGSSKVICVARGGHRAEAAGLMGAEIVFNSKEERWEEQYWQETRGLGSDLVIDTGGNVDAMQLAYRLTKRGERCVFASIVRSEISIDSLGIILDEKEIMGSVAHSHEREFAWAVKYISDGRLNVKPIITDRIFISDALELGIKALISDRSHIKVLVTPRKELVRSQ
ncbi:MAG: zinc-binding dehydrogenase, partial [Synergistaceae bacterium]|nr:zinc-binding dehydrogenase [Synergistaceae bacterium]